MSREGKKLGRQLAWIILPLAAGVGIYYEGRKTRTRYEQWFQIEKGNTAWQISNWLPDFFWCISLLAAVSLVWNGWDKVPKYWKIVLWVGICSTEWLQHQHWIPGTGDWWDILAYQLAFVFIYFLHKKTML
ncbi:MAG TPA: hypothetical protein VG842_11670 [Sediminibacterium sp.]|nr:hypothetical protein [Sediminibacterium sp.]